MNTKQQKAEFLLSEIGNIDDVFVAEPLEVKAPSAVRRRRAWLISLSAAAAAACLALVSVLWFRAFLLPLISQFTSRPETKDSMIEALQSITPSATVSDPSELDFFGEPCLVWQLEEGGEYNVVTLTGTQSEHLSYMSGGGDVYSYTVYSGELTPAGVWILAGDGTAVSPYLEPSGGNVGYNELMEYSPEIIPQGSYAEYVSRLGGN